MKELEAKKIVSRLVPSSSAQYRALRKILFSYVNVTSWVEILKVFKEEMPEIK